jgi:hypothetical protein
VSDLRGSPPSQNGSSIYGFRRAKGNASTTCFDGQAKPTGTPAIGDVACQDPSSVYRLYLKLDQATTDPKSPPLAHAYLRVTWPALASPSARPSGSVETVTAYFFQQP